MFLHSKVYIMYNKIAINFYVWRCIKFRSDNAKHNLPLNTKEITNIGTRKTV